MTAKISYDDVEVGTELPAQTFPVTRATLVQYAGASGDFNPIHWNEKFAKEVGLPDVIAHGMFTMAEAIRVVTDWAGDPGAVVEYGVRFTKPVVVPNDDEGAVIEVSRQGRRQARRQHRPGRPDGDQRRAEGAGHVPRGRPARLSARDERKGRSHYGAPLTRRNPCGAALDEVSD